jgi:hypothetical protein
MLNFFKKKKQKSIKVWEYNLLIAIANILPSKYDFFKSQANEDFILDSTSNPLLNENWKRVSSNLNLAKKNCNKNINYILTGILVYDNNRNRYKNVEIDFYEGIIIGYNFGSNNENFDLTKINIEKLKEKTFENTDKKLVESIIGKENDDILSKLDIDDTIKIEIEDGVFYTIKNLEDGNYVSIDEKGIIYEMSHDPYKVRKIFENSRELLVAISNGKFKL